MTDTSPITRDEMIAMFGDAMPIEAVQILWNVPGETTFGEIRAQLREIAANRKDLPRPLLERLRAEAANWSASCGSLFDEAADEIERLTAALRTQQRQGRELTREEDDLVRAALTASNPGGQS